ncbi:PAS domain S-box-containing protein [Methanomicrobium sp. W14]|uniref:PAS domain-containing protein n=1 Tax=Methanomicrobium sp. W14 TaxID=2817839 RepID=UPI001AEA04DC|nr:PAS domain S-box protein [Methanomicrobium sp. W14]MBP2133491.1 PAS domain S-box-containing protein [Methanomicrobium sp. W14]
MGMNVNSGDLLKWANDGSTMPGRIWKMMYDAFMDPVLILSTEGVILACNKASEIFLDLKPEEIIGNYCYKIVHNSDNFTQDCPLLKSLKSKKRESYRLVINERWYQMVVDPLINENGEVIGAVHLISDINDIVSLNASEKNLLGIIENSQEAIGEFSFDGIIDYWNRGAEEILGYKKEEIIGKKVDVLILKERMFHYYEVLETVKKKKKVERFDTRIITKSGQKKEVSIGIQPVFDEFGEPKAISFMAYDLSPQKMAERELLFFAAESAMRLKKPVEIIKNNLEDIRDLFSSGDLSTGDVESIINVQVKSAEQILENLRELHNNLSKLENIIPADYSEFLREKRD